MERDPALVAQRIYGNILGCGSDITYEEMEAIFRHYAKLCGKFYENFDEDVFVSVAMSELAKLWIHTWRTGRDSNPRYP